MFKYIKIILITSFATFTLGFSQDDFSLSFDGEDDYIQIADDPSLAFSDVTIAFLIKTESSSEGKIIDKDANPEPEGGDWNIGITDEGNILAVFRKESGDDQGYNNFTSTTQINDGTWHSVIITRESSSGLAEIWIDGVLDASDASGPLGEIYNDSDLNIGRRDNTQGEFFNGLLDNVSIWGRIINNQEKQDYPSYQITGTEVDLISYWNFNEGFSNIVEDIGGSDNEGLIFGATWSEDAPIGCNDPLAENYDEGSTFNDGSCEYPNNGD